MGIIRRVGLQEELNAAQAAYDTALAEEQHVFGEMWKAFYLSPEGHALGQRRRDTVDKLNVLHRELAHYESVEEAYKTAELARQRLREEQARQGILVSDLGVPTSIMKKEQLEKVKEALNDWGKRHDEARRARGSSETDEGVLRQAAEDGDAAP